MRYLTLTAVLLLGGCTALGLTPAKNLDQSLGYAEAGVTTALNTIAQATTAGGLSSVNATKANSMVLQAQTILTAARAAENTNVSQATNDLALATSALTAVQQYLTANGVKQ